MGVSEEIAAATEETDVAAAEAEVGAVITEETIAEVHHLGTMMIALNCATMKNVDLQDIMKTWRESTGGEFATISGRRWESTKGRRGGGIPNTAEQSTRPSLHADA